ncbi:VRR-NUC domain-containing protein [Sporosarcina sp. P21c]|uniref:VRR-NUC domain-containing protein n=1 Tax=Sporosarcina sp. P21c TaxID=2048255 RepID=UPI001E52EB46|nr:VRR-NUC domain-containing protein [Sporosarcina sp. P21c]
MTSIKSEATIQAEIMLAVSQQGHSVWRSNAGSVRDARGFVVKLFPKGFPDLVGFRKTDGKFFVIEVKNSKGRLGTDQKRFAEFASRQPIIYGVCRSAEEAVRLVTES